MVITNIENLGRFSKKLILVKCDKCSLEKNIMMKLYTVYGYQDKQYLCRKCKLILNNNLKYNVDNVFQLETTKIKTKETNLKKYGVEYISQSSQVKEKKIETALKKYGNTHHMKSKEIFDKLICTNLEKYNVDNISKLDYIKDKKIETCNINFNADYIRLSKEFRKKFNICKDINYLFYKNNGISVFKCEKNHEFEINIDNYIKRNKYKVIVCTICNPIGSHKSQKEIEILNFIKKNYNGKVISGYRDNLEIDIYLPELKLGFEFNGLYWHSEKFKNKNYHIEKLNYFNEKEINIINIWEDDWLYKQDIVKSEIFKLLKIYNNIIDVNCCSIRLVDVKDCREFLNKNHLQGFTNSNKRLGLYYKEELVSIMLFKKINKSEWKLSRFCNLCHCSLVDSQKKLLDSFQDLYKCEKIITYVDKCSDLEIIYKSLGFLKISESKPDFKYLVDSKRVNKSNLNKLKLKSNTLYKIYDCGKIKYQLL